MEQALLSVRQAARGLDVEIFVVDNDSKDDSVEMVRQKFPEVCLIANRHNPGFSIANNQAIRQASGKYILLLNPDTVVEEDTFKKCLAFMEAHPDAGGLGVKMIDGAGKFLPESKRGFPSPWVAFCKSAGLSRLFPKSKIFNRYHLGFLDENETQEVDVLAGAFMLLRKSALDKAGLLDEAFFMYGEDIDLSYRLVKAGFKNYYFPDATIIHYKGESTRKGSLNYVKAFYNAMIIFAKKHFTGSQARLFVWMLQMAIYFQASLTLVRNFVKAVWLPLLDALFMLAGMIVLKNFWADYYFQNPGYFDQPKFYFFNIPLYIGIWLSSIFLNGGYDSPASSHRLVRGIFTGTLVLAAVYGFLPADYRFSRALIVLGAVWALLSVVGLRVLIHFLKYKNFDLGGQRIKNLLIVGNQSESDRVLKLLQQAGVQKNFIGKVSPGDDFDKKAFLGSIAVLDDLVHIYNADEIIFCSSDVSAQQIMTWMTRLSPAVEFKILPQESLSIIGSSSKNTPGELYTIDIRYAIATPENRRNKRAFDFFSAILILPILPFLWLFSKSYAKIYKNWWRVLTGKMTWVGYAQNSAGNENLPRLKKGVFTPPDGLRLKEMDGATTQRLDFLYAKDYTTWRDLSIFWKKFFGV